MEDIETETMDYMREKYLEDGIDGIDFRMIEMLAEYKALKCGIKVV